MFSSKILPFVFWFTLCFFIILISLTGLLYNFQNSDFELIFASFMGLIFGFTGLGIIIVIIGVEIALDWREENTSKLDQPTVESEELA